MKSAIILENEDLKKIIAEHFHVDERSVIKSQYTWTVVTDGHTEQKRDIIDKASDELEGF